MDAFSLCQDESVFNQLAHGIRYLDLRVMYTVHKNVSFWMAHDILQLPWTLEQILLQVKEFLQATAKEVVILDFHRFPLGKR